MGNMADLEPEQEEVTATDGIKEMEEMDPEDTVAAEEQQVGTRRVMGIVAEGLEALAAVEMELVPIRVRFTVRYPEPQALLAPVAAVAVAYMATTTQCQAAPALLS